MKQKLRRPLAALAALALLACGAFALASGDSLISLSALRDTFFPEAAEKGAQAGGNKLQQTYDEAVKNLDQARQELTGHAGLYSESLEGRDWADGDVLTLPTGSGLLMLEGTARVEHGGAVVDVTAGAETASGATLVKGHRYLVGEDAQARVTVLSGAARLGVQGEYTYTKGQTAATPFYDVCQTDWFYAPVGFAYENKLFSGTGDNQFSPGMAMDRAMLMTVLYRLAGSPESELASAQASFTDVEDSKWYASFVRWGAAQKITAGTGDGTTFSPEQKVNREQVVVLLYSFGTRYLGKTLDTRADLSGYQDLAEASDWARDALSWAVSQGIVSGTSTQGLTLSPRRDATRAEVAAMLRTFSEKVK